MTEKPRGEMPEPIPEAKEKKYEVKLTETDITLLIEALQTAAKQQMNEYQKGADISYYGESPAVTKQREKDKAKQLERWERLNDLVQKIKKSEQ